MKKLILVLVMFMLCGCATVTDEGIKNELSNVFATKIDTEIRNNNRLKYFSYYLPSDFKEESYGDDYSILLYENSKVLMNINVADMINSQYYEKSYPTRDSFFDESRILYSYDGFYGDEASGYVNYSYRLYSYDEDYLASFKTDEMCFYAYGKKNDAVNVASHLLMIAQSVDLDRESIISQYSVKETVDYEKKQISLFDRLVPTEGRLEDIVIE